MSSLANVEKRSLERVLGVGSGYVLDFTDVTFGELFERHDIDLHGRKYRTSVTSKAKKLRMFWALETDQRVGAVLSELLDSYEVDCNFNDRSLNRGLLEEAHGIAGRLNSQYSAPNSRTTEREFLAREFSLPDIQKISIDTQVMSIVEARITLAAGAHLSLIFLCGSVLEAVLLGAAQQTPAKFNQANATPKANNGSPKRFHEWSLAQSINIACETGVLKPGIKKFSHGLRDFRNYIHPYEQMVSGFTPDEHTAKICFQILKAALANLAGERP